MLISDNLYFSNDGTLGTYSYTIELYSIMENTTHTYTGNVTIDDKRFIVIPFSDSDLITGKYKGELYVNSILNSTFIAIKEFTEIDKYVNNDTREKYIVEL